MHLHRVSWLQRNPTLSARHCMANHQFEMVANIALWNVVVIGLMILSCQACIGSGKLKRHIPKQPSNTQNNHAQAADFLVLSAQTWPGGACPHMVGSGPWHERPMDAGTMITTGVPSVGIKEQLLTARQPCLQPVIGPHGPCTATAGFC